MSNDKHIFAFYLHNLSFSPHVTDTEFIIKDKILVSRMLTVVRVNERDDVVLFDEQIAISLVVTRVDIKKNVISGLITLVHRHTPYKNTITLYQCLTQKSAFEEIVYTATQMGVASIVPVISAKVQRKWDAARDGERLQKMMIAAAEQSKNFTMPHIEAPITLTELVSRTPGIFFSVGGTPFFTLMKELSENQNPQSYSVLIGAEGGLTNQEELELRGMGWKSYQLTPSILRAVDAVILGLGSIRSIKNI